MKQRQDYLDIQEYLGESQEKESAVLKQIPLDLLKTAEIPSQHPPQIQNERTLPKKKGKRIKKESDRRQNNSNEKQKYKRKDKSNTDFKHYAVVLKNIYLSLTSINNIHYQKYKADKGRQDYFVVILNLLQRQKKLQKAKEIYEKQVKKKESNSQRENVLIERHSKAFDQFCQDSQLNYQKALKTLYPKVKNPQNFDNALEQCIQMRKYLGLPFVPIPESE